MTDPDKDADPMLAELAALRGQLATLNANRALRIHGSWWRLMWFNFLRGIALGLGTVVGATILVSVAAYFLTKIDFIPIIGDWAAEIAAEIQQPR